MLYILVKTHDNNGLFVSKLGSASLQQKLQHPEASTVAVAFAWLDVLGCEPC